ncbi:hypothetical protein FQA39_LY11729 [Lamprigera yunnana]|nr:hypothetical protein FQA39_LY11729 [Lamprigera yunnana]
MMKILILLFMVIFASCEEYFDQDKEDCVKDLKLNREEIVKLDKLDLPPDDNDGFNKFVICHSKKTGLMSETGEILFQNLKNLLLRLVESKGLSKVQKYFYENLISNLMDACKLVPTDSNPGKNMIYVHRCLYNEMAEVKKSLTII